MIHARLKDFMYIVSYLVSYNMAMKNKLNVITEKYLVKIPYSNDGVNTIHFIFLDFIKLTSSKTT